MGTATSGKEKSGENHIYSVSKGSRCNRIVCLLVNQCLDVSGKNLFRSTNDGL